MKSVIEIKKIAKDCIAIEHQAIEKLKERIDDNFVDIIKLLLNTKGRLIIAGIGKSANIANKMVATFNSTGQPSIFLHAADAIHGDLGNIQSGDVVMCISKSGNTPEIKALLPLIKNMNTTLICMTGNLDSYLAKESEFILDVSVNKEACPNNLAPTSSTTAQLVMGDALAMALLEARGFTEEDFAFSHPGGSLGKKLLLRTETIMHKGVDIPAVSANTMLGDALLEISSKTLGMTTIVDDDYQLLGIFTDGDLRRTINQRSDIHNLMIAEVMTESCKTISAHMLAAEALAIMEENKISELVVVNDQRRVTGVLTLKDLLKAGIA